jgi:hypothetical protein
MRATRDTTTAPPEPAEGFRWTRREPGWVLECHQLAPLVHGWTTRTREPAEVAGASHDSCGVGWNDLAALGGVEPDRVRRLRQVHSSRVVEAAASDGDDGEGADGVVTRDPSLLLTVRVADCVPLLIADAATGAVGAIHAGWRGTAAGIAVRAVERMTGLFGSRAADLVAAVGPAIGPCCYEVGSELRESFLQAGWQEASVKRWFGAAGGERLDLWLANRDQLIAAGVPEPAVVRSKLCTVCHPEWSFSYRREGARTGRMFAFIRPGSSR